MSATPPPAPPERDSKDEAALRALLKRSTPAPGAPTPDLLKAVQRKIRRRSKGKFFADGWSTGAGGMSYMLVALAMLLVIAVAYFALGPVGVSR